MHEIRPILGGLACSFGGIIKCLLLYTNAACSKPGFDCGLIIMGLLLRHFMQKSEHFRLLLVKTNTLLASETNLAIRYRRGVISYTRNISPNYHDLINCAKRGRKEVKGDPLNNKYSILHVRRFHIRLCSNNGVSIIRG